MENAAFTQHYDARDFSSIVHACRILGITYKSEAVWDWPDLNDSPLSTLSPEVDRGIHILRTSPLYLASAHSAIGLLMLDRLRHISDKGPPGLDHLELGPGRDFNLLHTNKSINGRPGLLLFNKNENGIDSALIAIEARCGRDSGYSEQQMATNLAAIQDRRARKSKTPPPALGITTDGTCYRFWLLDSGRQLISSQVFDWRTAKATIIAWIDKILAETIEAFPPPTPTIQN